ncbi:MAG: hypothetical protein Q8O94_02850 [bacterium]|nr:hypothetical protein [bacterium]
MKTKLMRVKQYLLLSDAEKDTYISSLSDSDYDRFAERTCSATEYWVNEHDAEGDIVNQSHYDSLSDATRDYDTTPAPKSLEKVFLTWAIDGNLLNADYEILLYDTLDPNPAQVQKSLFGNPAVPVTSRQEILAANRVGLSDTAFWSYWTPILNIALDLGREGVDLSSQPDFSGPRYGKAPALGVSTNYADNVSERGLSLSVDSGGEVVGSSIWFLGREKTEYTGLLLPYTGSDGEALILPYGFEIFD